MRARRMTPRLWPFWGDARKPQRAHAFFLAGLGLQPPGDGRRDELRHVAAHQRDLAHQRAVMWRTPGLAGRNTVSMPGAMVPFMPAICIS